MPRRRRSALAVAVLAVVASSCTSGQPGDAGSPEEAAAGKTAAAFGRGWETTKLSALRGVTDDPHAALDTIKQADSELGITQTRLHYGKPQCRRDRCTERVDVTHDLASAGQWSYSTTVDVRHQRSGRWLVHWTPQTFHPALRSGTELQRIRSVPARASILDRSGRPLTAQRRVVRIGVVAGKVKKTTYGQLARLLGIDAAGLRERVHAAEKDWFVDVITLRRGDYQPLRKQLLGIPGISLDPGRMALAPTSSWGRAVLGTVAPATAETLRAAGPLASATDLIGAGGLQEAYQRELAGTPGVRVQLVDAKSGKTLQTLLRRKPVPGAALRTTLDYTVQDAAERALTQQKKPTAFVAVQASTGDVLAAANGPDVTSYNTAFVGEYPPGSTFKVVTAATLLEAGVLHPRDRVSCPDSVTVGGKTFSNYDLGLLPSGGTFTQAFAESCNTTMVEHAHTIGDAALPEMAKRLGVGARWDLGLDAYSGQVPTPTDIVARAAAMIGQGQVLESPLGMAMVAAAADSGQARTPTLLPADKPGGPVGQPLPKRLVRELHTMMRAVVTNGTGTSVNLPGLPVYAKTGTAEYGAAPTRTHAWMIGFRGDLAFAVLVVNGESGAHDAAPVVRSFLRSVPARVLR